MITGNASLTLLKNMIRFGTTYNSRTSGNYHIVSHIYVLIRYNRLSILHIIQIQRGRPCKPASQETYTGSYAIWE